MPDAITTLQRELAETRFARDQLAQENALLRTELTDLRPRVSNHAHTIARLERELAAARSDSAPAPVPASEPLPTDPAPLPTDRFHNGG